MGFSGGGSNVLLPHTHDGTVAQDGGPLNFNNITQSQSAAGQVFYSDGVHLQQLSIGNASDELRVNAGATAPEWYTPAASSTKYELVGESVLGVGASTLTVSFTAINCSDIAFLKVVMMGEYQPSQNVFLQINGINTGTSYHMFGMSATGALTDRTNNDKGFEIVNNNLSGDPTTPFYATVELSGNPVTEDAHYNSMANANGGMNVLSGYYDGSNITSFNEITLDTSTSTMSAGTRLLVYKVLN